MQVPVDYKVLGGEASQLFPRDLHDLAKEDLLESGGWPVNLYKADLTVEAAPVGLRLFEAQNRIVPLMNNHALRFVTNRITELAGRDPVKAKHERVTLVDNIEFGMMRLQLAMSGQTSMTNALKPFNMNFQEEARQNNRDQAFLMQLQTEQQEELANQQGGMQQIQQQMAPPADQAQGGGGGGGEEQMQDPTAGMLPSNGLVIPEDLQGMEGAISSLAQNQR